MGCRWAGMSYVVMNNVRRSVWNGLFKKKTASMTTDRFLNKMMKKRLVAAGRKCYICGDFSLFTLAGWDDLNLIVGAKERCENCLSYFDDNGLPICFSGIIHQAAQPATIWNLSEDIKPNTIIIKEKNGTYTFSRDGGIEWKNESFDDLMPFLQLAWLAHEYAKQRDEIDKLPEVTRRAYAVIDRAWQEISEIYYWGDKGITIVEK